ncbi:hypothetical protein LUZ63_005967 [Rhynchospora breviuscula]|uniref:Uncharacterized protein n=1 Tax=Rhynchospora breviuscula TaxID=2022672 RepID=A0A9Q0HTJ8_9POAL|nr:hypothetical protein LUZ63_005967 [Rhynchospora breviuscula]
MATMATKPPLLEEFPSPSLRISPSRLHNFTFPTPGWGAGKALRCIKEASVERGGSPEEVPSPSKVRSVSPEEAAENADLPWNLRRRRASSYKGDSSKLLAGASGKPKVKFSVSLSSKEIEEDFLLMNGKKPLKRPKKRPKHVQKQLDALFPGMWLSDEITPDLYKVE